MNKLEKIEEILNGSSSRLRESFFMKNYNQIYSEIIDYCKNLDVSFKQKIWHWVNNYPNDYLCKCGGKTTFNKNWLDGYRKNCSAKCAQTEDTTKEKRKTTNLEKYGVDNVAKSEQSKKKQEATNLEKYGTKSSFQNKEVQEKYKITVQEKYGVDHYFQTETFKIDAKKHYLKKYGVTHQSRVDSIQDKIKQTCLEKYGVSTYLNTEHSRSSIKVINRSSYEDEICTWLDKLNIKYQKSVTTILKPLSIDIYIPSVNLALEFNGLYWHSELFKNKDYHLNKTLNCEKKGINLIHIWEDDWKLNKNIIKSIIKNKLNIVTNKIFARKCIIKKCTNSNEVSDFLNQNHIQGYVRSKDNIGLYYNDELVSIMSFGWRSINSNKQYELVRFCNKIDTNIIGAASKLFKYYIKTKEIDSITSFADRSMFDGNLYNLLEFKFIHRTVNNYWWVVNGLRRHRFTYNKQKLIKMGYDPMKTEVEIMHELGNYRIFGCGQDKYVWTR